MEELNLSTSSSSSDDEFSIEEPHLETSRKDFSELASFDEDSCSETLSRLSRTNSTLNTLTFLEDFDQLSEVEEEQFDQLPVVAELDELEYIPEYADNESVLSTISDCKSTDFIQDLQRNANEINQSSNKMITVGPDLAH